LIAAAAPGSHDYKRLNALQPQIAQVKSKRQRSNFLKW
jgi:hypothetical protein